MTIHNTTPEIAQILEDLDVEINAKLDTDGLIKTYYTFSDAQLESFINMTQTTPEVEEIIGEFSKTWHKHGIPNGCLPHMQLWIRTTLTTTKTDKQLLTNEPPIAQ